jgi:hypothetical protein
METVNPKNFIDIDPYIVSFITLKDGNMIMIDELTPAKPNKVKILSESEIKENNNNINVESLNKEKAPELSLSEQIYFSFIGNKKNEEPITIINKNDFNIISNISNNINFSIINKEKKIHNNFNETTDNNTQNNYNNISSHNSSIDIKSSMFQSKRDKNNINNILNEDNVNINLTDINLSNQLNNKYNNNDKKTNEIMPSNIFAKNLTENNINIKKNKIRPINKIIEDTQKYTFDEKTNDDNININNTNKNSIEKNNIKKEITNENNKNNYINYNNSNGNNISNYNYINNKLENNDKSYISNPSLIIQNNNFYSNDNYNNYQKNNINANEQNRNNDIEITTQDYRSTSKKYSRLSRLRHKRKDNNYIKAVVSINIPGEEQENINLVKQFNSLVDRLNGQKSQTQAREIIKRSDRYYELYKNPNESIINSFISPEKNRKILKYNYLFDNNIKNNSKNGDSNIYNNDVSDISYKKYNNNNLNSRIMALKERTTSNINSMNNSFMNENNTKNIYRNRINNNSDIVLPSNFSFHKYK